MREGTTESHKKVQEPLQQALEERGTLLSASALPAATAQVKGDVS